MTGARHDLEWQELPSPRSGVSGDVVSGSSAKSGRSARRVLDCTAEHSSSALETPLAVGACSSGASRAKGCTALTLRTLRLRPHLTRIAIQGGAAPGLPLATPSGRSQRGSDRLAPHARPHRSAQCGFARSSATVRGRGTANSRLPLRVLTDGGKPRHADQAALPSVAVAAAARRSTLPSGPRGTASTAHSRSGAL